MKEESKILKLIQNLTGSQCMEASTKGMFSSLFVLVMSLVSILNKLEATEEPCVTIIKLESRMQADGNLTNGLLESRN